MSEPSVVSLLPAATEILYALGVEPAAVTHECTHPPAAAERPRATRSLVAPDASSEEVNRVLEAHGDLHEFDRDVLLRADPDLVVTQGLCDICAVDSVAVRDVLADLALEPAVLTTDPHTIDDVLGSIRRVGDAVGRADSARDLVDSLRARIDAVRAAATRATARADRPRTLVIDWLDPPMVAGHWISGLVAAAGGRYGIGEPGGRATPQALEAIVEFDPEVLVVSPCGLGIDRARDDLDLLAARDGWSAIAAVRDGHVYAMDGDVLNCPSPRLVDALETLGFLLHGEAVAAPAAAYEPLAPRPASG